MVSLEFKNGNRHTKVGGSWILSTTDKVGLYLLSVGLADAKIEVREGNEQTIPACRNLRYLSF